MKTIKYLQIVLCMMIQLLKDVWILEGCRLLSCPMILIFLRYFVLKIQNAQGKHAFIGIAFNERNDAFDFNVALSEFKV
jgi:hypothetical protein